MDINGAEYQLKSGRPFPTGVYDYGEVDLSEDVQIALKHVEGHAASIMQENNISVAHVYINYIGGPCQFCRGQGMDTSEQELLGEG
ncbi:DddA-like double-stranded DNA deaminase toxin [Microbulbifer sp. TRSA007]|uniref:DddA-like double-stranded DNA deaminase toxin n=1 Tax=Microbulbifer sp. TRSA007 TaxID=3243384 RepID=UPI00403A27B5